MSASLSPQHVTDGELRIRPLRDLGTDYLLLSHWLSDHRVLAWYQGRDHPFDLARAREDLRRLLEVEP